VAFLKNKFITFHQALLVFEAKLGEQE